MGLTILGIVLLIYGAFCLLIGIIKFGAIWNMAKIQAFVKIMGDTGTRIFITVWGLIAAGIGVWLTFFK